jgi:hypothetical protein
LVGSAASKVNLDVVRRDDVIGEGRREMLLLEG